MLCFRAMTFCSAKCETVDCRRQFTAEQQAAAQRWWGGEGAPVMFADFSGSCADYRAISSSEQDHPHAE